MSCPLPSRRSEKPPRTSERGWRVSGQFGPAPIPKDSDREEEEERGKEEGQEEEEEVEGGKRKRRVKKRQR